MQVVLYADRGELHREGPWHSCAGPFSCLTAAEGFIDKPPPDVPHDATVTIEPMSDGFHVLIRDD